MSQENSQLIDPKLKELDLFSVLLSEILRKDIAGHHIQSMNLFYVEGIKQIITSVFDIEGRIKNLRTDQFIEGQPVSEVLYNVKFSNIRIEPPTTIKDTSGQEQILTPSTARQLSLTYSVRVIVDATVTVTAMAGGHQVVRTAEIKNRELAKVPCMVRSIYCHTYNASKDTLKRMGEDPLDPGGYFIIKGTEWAIVNLENQANNIFHVHKNMYKNELARGSFLSKPGDGFENMYQTLIRLLRNGAITIEVTTSKKDKFEIPFYLIFRALGVSSDKEIIEMIVYSDLSRETPDHLTTSLIKMLEQAFAADAGKFADIQHERNPTTVIQAISQKLNENLMQTSAGRRDENVLKYLNASFLNKLNTFILPHVGMTEKERGLKARFLGYLINKLLLVHKGILPPTNRDSQRNKRIHSAGISFAKTFKTDFNFVIVHEIRKHFQTSFRDSPFSSVPIGDVLEKSLANSNLEKMLVKAIISGNKTLTIKRNEIVNRISSQALHRKNDINVKSTLNTINASNSMSHKQTERADEMRRVHTSNLGYIDPSQSPDTGEDVGMTNQQACTASISPLTSSFQLREILTNDPDIVPLDGLPNWRIRNMTKVFLNGSWIGCSMLSHELAKRYRDYRRAGKIYALTSIVWELGSREIHFMTDVGRLLRPLIIVYNNQDEYDAALTSAPTGEAPAKPPVFRQWIRLTTAHILKLQTNEIGMDDLVREGIIEYIAPDEQENLLLAPNITTLRENANNVLMPYTHLEIEQSIFGIVTLAAPMGNHSNTVRNTMYTNHRKQAAGWFALNYPHRMDKNTVLQWYCDRPIASTFSDTLTYPSGQNVIVALALYGGENCEDSIKVNKSSVDCGMFNASFYNFERVTLEKNELFADQSTRPLTMDLKSDANYDSVGDGYWVKEGTIVKSGDVLVAKVAKLAKPIGKYKYTDRSVIYRRDEPVYIEKVVETREEDSSNLEVKKLIKIKWRANRPLIVGDKLSSRTGNKGICSVMVPRCDMPYTEDGLVPDLIVNSHSIPTRMALNQLIECTMGILGATRGTHIDATTFMRQDIDGMIEMLEKHGLKNGGHRRMYNGLTGEWLDTLIFVGTTTYQRLQKFVIDEHYATLTGPTSVLTRQPLEGRAHDGGLRIGEMEGQNLSAHGTMRAFHEKFYRDSDGMFIYVCRGCGARAIVNEERKIYNCRNCGDLADIARVPSSWASNLFLNEAGTMNVDMRLELEPHRLPIREDELTAATGVAE